MRGLNDRVTMVVAITTITLGEALVAFIVFLSVLVGTAHLS